MSQRFVVVSGCSGGGKSTLLAALSRAGYATIPEPGRRVIRAGGPAPWEDLPGFLSACVTIALADHGRASAMAGPVIFDRSLVDAVSGLDALGAPDGPARSRLLVERRYGSPVFLVPPWASLFGGDRERHHGFPQAVAEYERLLRGYPAAGYAVEIMPKVSVAERVAWIAARIGPPGAG
jgi:predicted ATPase